MTNESYILINSGNIGQEIISPQGKVIAWTTDPLIGAFLTRVLNELYSDENLADTIFGDNDTTKEEKNQ